MDHRRCQPSLTIAIAGISLLGLAAATNAAVVSRDLNVVLTANAPDPSANPARYSTYDLDVDVDGASEFTFHQTQNPQVNGSKIDYNGKLTLDGAQAAQFIDIVKDTDSNGNPVGNYAEVLRSGALIGPTSTFISAFSPSYDNRLLDSSGSTDGGAFSIATGERTAGETPISNGEEIYIGFRFGDPLNPNYGYMQFASVYDDIGSGDSDYNTADLVAVTYQTTPGVSITIPEPASFAAVMACAAGLIRRRRSRLAQQ